jgi:predicted RNase H-like HicB family nuclease
LKLRYAVIIESGPENFSAYSPDLPGCVATGRTLEDTRKNMREAIQFHLEGMRASGEMIPDPQNAEVFLETIQTS